MPHEETLKGSLEKIDAKQALSDPNPLKLLKPKQRRFLKYFLKTKNRVTAWQQSHKGCHSYEAAYVGATRFLQDHPEVVDWLYGLAGIGDDEIVAVVQDSFSATRTIPLKGGGSVEEKDHYARLKGAELALKIRGKGEGKAGGNTMNIQIVSDKDKGVFKIIEGEEA